MKSHVRYFDIRPFGGIYLGCTISEKKLKKEIKRLSVSLDEGSKVSGKSAVVHTFYRDSGIVMIVYFNVKAYGKEIDIIQFHALIVHEVVHIWKNILEHIKEKYPGEEIEAYFHQYYFTKITEYLHKKLKKRLKL